MKGVSGFKNILKLGIDIFCLSGESELVCVGSNLSDARLIHASIPLFPVGGCGDQTPPPGVRWATFQSEGAGFALSLTDLVLTCCRKIRTNNQVCLHT